MIDRWIYPYNEVIVTDQYGLLDKSMNSSKLIPANEILTMNFAIVVANSGMGKTMLIDAFMTEDSNFVKIDCEYISPADERIIESTYNNITTPIAIFFDQVENKENQLKVKNHIRHFKKSLQNSTNPSGCQVRFYFFLKYSEFLDELRKTISDCYHDLKIEIPKSIVWQLSPFSFDEISLLANQEGILDLVEFKEKIIRSKLINFCSNSLIAKEIVKGYKDSHNFDNPNQLWKQSINRLFSPLNVEDEQFMSLDKAIQCAGWIAFCLFFQGKSSIWIGDQSNVEERYLSYSDLERNVQFTSSEIRKTLSTKIFNAPPSEVNARQFTHHLYQSYVAAEYMSTLHEKYYFSMIFNSELNQVIPKFEEVAAFLANRKSSIAELLLKYQPNLLISLVPQISLISPLNILEVVLSSIENFTYNEIANIVDESNLSVFNDPECHQYIQGLLNNGISLDYWTARIIINICITCSFSKITEDLIKYIKNENNSPDSRLIIIRGINKLATHDQKEALVKLLDTNLKDVSEDLLGALLMCLWPGVIPIQTVVNHLTLPKYEYNFGDYQYFLKYHLLYNLSKVNHEEVPILLQWCLDIYPSFKGCQNSLIEVIQKIFGYYWKCVNIPQIGDKYVSAYLLQMHEGLFLVPKADSDTSKYLPFEFEKQESRFIVLDKLLPLMSENYRLWQLIQGPYPLINFKDWSLIIERIKSTDNPKAPLWIEAIKVFIYRNPLSDSMWKDIDAIHGLFPTLIMTSEDFKKVIIEREQEQDNLFNTRNSDAIDRRRVEAQEKKRQSILDSIWQDNAYYQFESIAFWILNNFGESMGRIESISIKNSNAWNWFDVSIQERIITLAFDYLNQSNFTEIQEGEVHFGAAIASVLLESKDNNRFQKIPEGQWELFGVEVLSAYSSFRSELEPIIQYFSNFSDSYGKSYLYLLEHSTDNTSSFSLSNLFQYLSPTYQEITIEYLFKKGLSPELSSDVLIQLPKELIQHNATLQFQNFLHSVDNAYEEIKFIPYFKALTIINPTEFFYMVVEQCKRNTEWGKAFLKQITFRSWVSHDIQATLKNCNLDVLTDFYIWIETHYASANKPHHEGSYTPDILDEIYDLKDKILLIFLDENATQAFQNLERIKDAFPDNHVINNYLSISKKNYLKKQSHSYTIEELLSIIADNDGNKYIINNDKDLLALILENLREYENHLHKDCGAIPDLWNIIGDNPVHKSEEDFSDHIKRYLDSTFKNHGIVINREVQIRRKLYKDGEPGARTDIWIQAINKNGETITLCIEVKGNWNQSAQDALTDQLIGKYMNGPDRTATAGILLVGWFGDNLGGNWESKEKAIQDLSSQVEAARLDDWVVEKCLIDCTLP